MRDGVRTMALAIAAFFVAGSLTPAVAQGNVVSEVNSLRERVQSLETALSELRGQMDVQRASAIPAGSVAAFNLAHCPSGWKDFEEGVGRVIVGVGQTGGLSRRTLLEQGGEESHTLTVEELPAHRHAYKDMRYNDQIKGGAHQTPQGDEVGTRRDIARMTETTGGNAAHENMPPFVGLRYCTKT